MALVDEKTLARQDLAELQEGIEIKERPGTEYRTRKKAGGERAALYKSVQGKGLRITVQYGDWMMT